MTAFSWNATSAINGHSDSPSLGMLHWEPPSPEEVRRGGFFKPTEPDFAKPVGPPWPGKSNGVILQTPDDGQTPSQRTWGHYVPQLFRLDDVEHLVPGVADAFDQSIVQIGPQDEVVVQGNHNGTLWRSVTSGAKFERWCSTPRQCPEGMQTCASTGFAVLDDGTVLATLANTTRIRVYRGRYDESRSECTWDEGTDLPPLAPGDTLAASATRFKDLGSGHVLYPMGACRSGGGPATTFCYGLLYETVDHGRSWVMRSVMGKYRNEMDVLSLDSAGDNLIAAVRYQTTGGPHPREESLPPDPTPRYKQSAIQFSSDGGFTWGAPRVVTGYLQQTACIVKLSDGTLVLPFAHKPTVKQPQGNEGYGQRFIVSYDNGTSWSNRIFSLHTGESHSQRLGLRDARLTTGGPGQVACTPARWCWPTIRL